ncbi:MAG: hypothetical protein ACK5HR_06335 [Mycoplasmatales bacterium]
MKKLNIKYNTYQYGDNSFYTKDNNERIKNLVISYWYAETYDGKVKNESDSYEVEYLSLGEIKENMGYDNIIDLYDDLLAEIDDFENYSNETKMIMISRNHETIHLDLEEQVLGEVETFLKGEVFYLYRELYNQNWEWNIKREIEFNDYIFDYEIVILDFNGEIWVE